MLAPKYGTRRSRMDFPFLGHEEGYVLVIEELVCLLVLKMVRCNIYSDNIHVILIVACRDLYTNVLTFGEYFQYGDIL